jgi:hypothetical protein
MNLEPNRVAHHEAGHTIAFLVHNFRVESVTVKVDGDFAGKTTPIEFPDETWNSSKLDAYLICVCAGPVAAFRYENGRDLTHENTDDLKARMMEENGQDAEVANYIGDLCERIGISRKAAIEIAWRRAVDCVKANRIRIWDFAFQLNLAGTLNEAAITRATRGMSKTYKTI